MKQHLKDPMLVGHNPLGALPAPGHRHLKIILRRCLPYT